MENEKEAAWEAERVGVYLSQHLKTFCDVLDIKLNDVAKKIDRPLSNISRLFATGTVTPDWYEKLDEALPALVEGAKVKLRTSGGIASSRIDEAERLIKGGCEQKVKTLMLLGESSIPDKYLLPKLGETERRKLMASLLQSPRFSGSVSEDEAVYEIASKPYPQLEKDRLGFVYHMLGDAVLESAGMKSDCHTQAAKLYRKAVSHNAAALISDYLQLMRCYMRTIKYEKDTIEEDKLYKEMRDLSARFDILSRIAPVPFVLIADEYKAHGEWLERVFEPDHSRIVDAFSRACRFYEQTLAERTLPSGKPPYDADTAHLQHNIGYCCWMAGRFMLGGKNEEPSDFELRREADARFKEARPHLEEALRINAVLGDAAKVAYNLKYLAWLHFYQGQINLAYWCIRASVLIYKNSRTGASEPDAKHAEDVQSEIEGLPPTENAGLTPNTDEFLVLARQYFGKRRGTDK